MRGAMCFTGGHQATRSRVQALLRGALSFHSLAAVLPAKYMRWYVAVSHVVFVYVSAFPNSSWEVGSFCSSSPPNHGEHTTYPRIFDFRRETP